MAASGVFINNHRYINGVFAPTSRKVLHFREKYIMLLVFSAFIIVCFGAVFFLPTIQDRSYVVVGLLEIRKHFQNAEGIFQLHRKIDLTRKFSKRNPHIFEPDLKIKSTFVNNTMKSINGIHGNMESRGHVVKRINMTIYRNNSMNFNGSGLRGNVEVEKRNKVKEMMKHAWDSYVKYAWGYNELRPISRRAHFPGIFGSSPLGATIVDAIDTLYIMELNKDFKLARDWIATKLNFDKATEVSVFETNIRFVGGLLSAYALSGDQVFKDKAVHIADKLLPAFNTSTGVPYAIINLQNGKVRNWDWSPGRCSILAEMGTLQLEFYYLSLVTGHVKYVQKAKKVRSIIKQLGMNNGLYPNYINPTTGKWGQAHVSIGALGDSFYEYLLKSYLITGKEDTEGKAMYFDVINELLKQVWQTSRSGLKYFAEMKSGRLQHRMDHLSCFSGGMLALGAKESDDEKKYLQLGADIAHTCHESYNRTAVKLGPEAFRFDSGVEGRAIRTNEKFYILRPEAVETYFYMWRLTKQQKYRDWAWEVVQAIEKHCRTDSGYTGLKDVYQLNSAKDDVQQSFFLAETLKYLFLIFSDDSLLPLDKWVLNTEAHPLPIKGGSFNLLS